MILTAGKRFGVVDVVIDKTAHVELVVTAQAVSINNDVQHYFLLNYRGQCLRLGVYLACRTAATSAFRH